MTRQLRGALCGRSFGHNCARAVLSVATVLAPVLAFVAQSEAGAAPVNAGSITLIAGAGGANVGQPITSGGSATPFVFKLPASAACSGDSATGGYQVQSYMVPATVDPASLTYDNQGPISNGAGAAVRLPLYDVTGSPYIDQLTDINTGFVASLPAFWLGVFDTAGPQIVPAGDYSLGLACTKGTASSTQVDKYWNIRVTVTHDAADQPSGLRWAVSSGGSTTTTSTTTATSTTAGTSTTATPSTTTTPASSTTQTSSTGTTAPTSSSSTVANGPTSSTTSTSTTTSSTTSTTTTRPPSNDARIGSQGIDTSLPATDSQMTVAGRGAFADLKVTVNQTKNLTNQAVSLSWSGGRPTQESPSRFGGNYLQIMQCWGEDDGTHPDNPGPPPEQCVQGAVGGTYGGIPGSLYPAGFALSRVISRTTWKNFSPSLGVVDPATTNVWLPFRSVDGTVVDIETDAGFNPAVVGGNFWLNSYFNIVTTNEIAAAMTGRDGKGGELMQVLTGVESSGLGCGQRRPPPGGGTPRIPKCWLVVVPRGLPSQENVGTPWEANADQFGVVTSPMSPNAWQNRIAIPIEFNPVDSPCSLADDERRLAGTELAFPAVASWQPQLCAAGDLPPYSFAPVSDATARQQLTSPSTGSPGMIVVSRPLTRNDPAKPVVYAPLTASGVVIGFNIERNVKIDAPTEERSLSGVRVAQLNLTPRLVAKLLTQSYRSQLAINAPPPKDYTWVTSNPQALPSDPDFLRFNPEFNLLDGSDRTFGGLVLPPGNSDAAQQVWEWILADPEAAEWLKGTPDAWGMKVNPVYSTSGSVNPSGLPFGTPTPNGFPKADPYCYQAPSFQSEVTIVPSTLCGIDWMPYARSFGDAARIGRAGATGAKVVQNPFALSASESWSREGPQYLGKRSMLILTDTPSASLFGLQTASLSRAGDNGDDRRFVAPNIAGLTAGVASMKAKNEPTVLEPDPAATAPGAYPLATLSYAAIAPLSLDVTARKEYAAFVTYASGPGQVSGLELGQLPGGYAPLPEAMRAQGASAAKAIVDLKPASSPDTSSTTTTGASNVAGETVTPSPQINAVSSGSGTTARRSTGSSATTTTATTLASETVPPVATNAPAPVTTIVKPPKQKALTPGSSVGVSRLGVPLLAGLIPLSALFALEITKRPRRAAAIRGGAPTGEK